LENSRLRLETVACAWKQSLALGKQSLALGGTYQI